MDGDLLDGFMVSLLAVDRAMARRYAEQALAGDGSILGIETLLTGALERIGRDWESGNVSLAQVYMAGRICENIINELLPLRPLRAERQPTAALAVLDDYHALGKRLVHAALLSAGYDIKDYGRLDAAGLVARVCSDQLEVVFVSVLMLPSALRVKDVCSRLRDQGSAAKVVVGGAPFRLDATLWQEVGAFNMGRAAFDAVHFLQSLSRVAP